MKLLIVFVFTTTMFIAKAQIRHQEKQGSCPPALPIQFCGRSCYVDAQCEGLGKCCTTQCGGTICSMPVTMSRPSQTEKSGSCPSVPTGRWVCTSTCNTDNDCKANLKCCKNRCGALACQKPEVEVIESTEIPFTPAASRSENNYND